MGTVHLVDALEKSLEGLRSGEVSASDARAMARTADAIFRMMRWAEEDVKKGSEFQWPVEGEIYLGLNCDCRAASLFEGLWDWHDGHDSGVAGRGETRGLAG